MTGVLRPMLCRDRVGGGPGHCGPGSGRDTCRGAIVDGVARLLCHCPPSAGPGGGRPESGAGRATRRGVGAWVEELAGADYLSAAGPCTTGVRGYGPGAPAAPQTPPP
ncbi:hypothetical protein, partial [Nocardia carnea]|uniref:hypothetical protein n=1 Tax=Nocardia carnea TaxID=37328 RepID=UPI002458FD71